MPVSRRTTGGKRCPVCHHRVNSRRHASVCALNDSEQVLVVCPPNSLKREGASTHNSVEAGFFPLVSAAHEFKTPLVVMLGYADLLRSGHLGPVNDKQRQVLGEIQESAERLQRVIQNLLLLSELRASATQGSGKVCLEAEAARVNENMQELFNYWAPVAQQRSIQYEFRPAVGDPRVLVEPLRLQHIVSNLIANALNHTPSGGQVIMSVAQCFWDRRKVQTGSLFRLERKVDRKINNAVCIAVTDTGPGIAPEYHEDIFLDFVQLPGAPSRGTGLGLAIARRLVEAHRGVIWVESAPGKGSKFLVLLSQTS
jgi:signal transduction histidine kinase